MNKKCQIFTPTEVVEDLLDIVEYKSGVFGKKVIDTACGEGNMLVIIVRRYIADGRENDVTNSEIIKGLERDIWGLEIDRKRYITCIEKLDLSIKKDKLGKVKWNVHNEDSLNFIYDNQYDFVIGNPPYINYRDLDVNTRAYIKLNFKSCISGKFDYCYAFVDHALSLLNENGKMAFLIPNSIFKNVFAQNLRNMIIEKITRIEDFRTIKLFNDVNTSSAFIVIENNSYQDEIYYTNRASNISKKIRKKNLIGKWVFDRNHSEHLQKKRFGDFFKASITIATLLNKAYILSEAVKCGDYYKVGNILIEKEVIRKAASPRNSSSNSSEHIIFPYYYYEGNLTRYRENVFEKRFPMAVEYLKQYSNDLVKRNSDKNSHWFEYGRSQALAHLLQKKLLLSTVVTNKVKTYEIGKETIPYSGIYIIPNTDVPLSIAKKILESDSFYDYVKSIGINASGNSLRITVADINNYRFYVGGDLGGQNEIQDFL
ncbi:MAG: SAM-dependent methyltransferase [Alkaliphilus sp.]|nr:N-6 DNA methylase [Alkaliphilus sp. AH-315-G20]PHS28926.1 MAG: SAM-dependent methyltransferase [Alkaliphilus sp.]